MAITLPESVRVLMPHRHVEEMKIETYLAGVVAAEIGVNVPLEALKAQAIASRTYVVSTQRHQEHGADVCTTAHCQKWRRVDPVAAPEVFRAVSETWGMVLTYGDALVNAFFFEHCDGHTRNSEEMLMPPMPYLRGVECACGFLAMRGHGVGMCKRGAIVMARRGVPFDRILQHYYRGVTILQASRNEANTVAITAPMPSETAAPARSRGRRKKPTRIETKPVTAIPPTSHTRPEARRGARTTHGESSETTVSKQSRRHTIVPQPPESVGLSAPPPEQFAPKSSDSSTLRRVVTPPNEPVLPKPSDSNVAPQSVARADEPTAPKTTDSAVRRKSVVVPPPKPTDASIAREPIISRDESPSAPRASEPVASREETPVEPRVPLDLPIAPSMPRASEPVASREETSVEPRVPLDLPIAPSMPRASEPVASREETPVEPRVPLDLPIAPSMSRASEPVASRKETPVEPRVPLDLPIAPSMPRASEPVASREETPVEPRVPLDLPIAPSMPRASESVASREETPVEPRVPLDLPVIMAVPQELKDAPATSASKPSVPLSQETSSVIAKRVHVDQLPGDRMIAGTLPRRGITLIIEDPQGNQKKLVSGTAPQYGDGGFEYPVAEDGIYRVTIGGRVIEVSVQGETAFIHAETTF